MSGKYKCSICGETGHTRATHDITTHGRIIEKERGTKEHPVCSICKSGKHYASWHRQEDIKEKKCSLCKLMLPIDCFSSVTRTHKTNGSEYKVYNAWCNNCYRDDIKRRYRSMDEKEKSEHIKNIVNAAKMKRESSLEYRIVNAISRSTARASRRGLDHDIDYEYIMEVYNHQEGKCFYSGDDLTLSGSSVISLERINSLHGYTKDNIVLCTVAVNRMKNSHTQDEFINLCGRIWNKANERK